MNISLAQHIFSLTMKHATQNNLDIAMAVTDGHGELITFFRLDNCNFHAGLLAQNKAYTAARDRQPSGNLGKWAQERGKDMGYWTDSKITGIAGGVPIYNDTAIIGALGISGLSEHEDEAIANLIISQLYL
jgi:glc operon protein GlcG